MKRISCLKGELCAAIALCEDARVKSMIVELHKIPQFQNTIDRYLESFDNAVFMEWLNEDIE